MGRPKGQPKTGGRAPGTPNRVTSLAKSVIADAAEALGGTERLVKWAKEDPGNEKLFWGTIYPKLVPVQVANDTTDGFKVVTEVQLVAVSKTLDHG